MAKQDKETYDSYEKDVYDNPPAGPMGVHRGARSAASRAMPYVIVIIVALLAGLLFWSIYSGEINNEDAVVVAGEFDYFKCRKEQERREQVQVPIRLRFRQ